MAVLHKMGRLPYLSWEVTAGLAHKIAALAVQLVAMPSQAGTAVLVVSAAVE